MRLRAGGTLFPGIIGYDDTVVPQIVNAILSRHNFILLGLRGQAKSRILRALTGLLDEAMPVVPGCEINDDPLAPLCARCRARVASEGDAPAGRLAAARRALRREARDAGRDDRRHDRRHRSDQGGAGRPRSSSDELTMHYGLLPRANRGIFAINELPDLAGKIQVGLFNILQEGDVQIKGYPVRLPLDVLMVFSANPEDYTARGKIITPLKDRIGSEIRTHYPATRQRRDGDHRAGSVGRARRSRRRSRAFVREIVEEIAFQARGDQKIDKRSGVSQRLPISLLENVVSNAERRALLAGEALVVPRVTDIYAALPAITGKFELEYEGELRGADNVARDIIRAAVGNVFVGYFANADLRQVIEWFDLGGTLQIDDTLPADELLDAAARRPGAARARGACGHPEPSAGAAAWRRPSTSCSKGSTRRRRSAAPTSSSTRAPSRRAARRAASRPEPMLEREMPAAAGTRRSTTTEVADRHVTSGSELDAQPARLDTRITKFAGEDLDGIDLEELLSKLSDLLLSSGFDNPYGLPYEDDGSRATRCRRCTTPSSRRCSTAGCCRTRRSRSCSARTGRQADDAEERLDELIEQIVEKLQHQGYLTGAPDTDAASAPSASGRGRGDGRARGHLRFEITDKSLDFLGYRALRDLLGSLGRSSFGRHDTRDMATGIEASGAPKPYEFGDTMNLDASGTILNAVARARNRGAISGNPDRCRPASTSTTRT